MTNDGLCYSSEPLIRRRKEREIAFMRRIKVSCFHREFLDV
jgi:hypothetical protein